MDTAESKKEIDAIFPDLPDVITIVGVAQIEEKFFAMARVIFEEDAELQPWPKHLEFRKATDVGSGVEMFIIFEPPHFMRPLALQAWGDSCEMFAQAANKSKLFLVEMVMPSHIYRAIVMDGKVDRTAMLTISPEEYGDLQNPHDPDELLTNAGK